VESIGSQPITDFPKSGVMPVEGKTFKKGRGEMCAKHILAQKEKAQDGR